MITVKIYLSSEKDALALVRGLMQAQLLAHASVDKDNQAFLKNGDEIEEQIIFVITGQTKALLFSSIAEFLAKNGHENAPLYSVPITQCNEAFSEVIRKNTKKV